MPLSRRTFARAATGTLTATTLAGAALLTLAGCGAKPAAEAPAADIVVYGRIWTGDSTAPWAQAVALRGDTIVAVGDSATVARSAGTATQVLRSAGLVTPGLMDSHVHLMEGGFSLTSVQLRTADSPAEFVRRIKEYAAKLQPGEWILGGQWDHERWPGSPLPTRQWMDSVTPNNPVFIERLDGHMGVANSKALALAGVTRATKDVAGGTIVRDAKGEPTGVLKDNAMGLVGRVIPAPSPTQADTAIARAAAYAASKGVTAVSAVSIGWIEIASIKRLLHAGKMAIRVNAYPPLDEWRKVADSMKANGPGDEWLRMAGVKGYVDGSLGSRTALFYEPYHDDPKTAGLLVTPEDSLRAWVGGADAAGVQTAVHAIGEKANGLILDIYDSLAKAHGPRDRRFRIEHAQHLRPGDVQRIAVLGVVPSMQPYHAIDDGRWAEKRVGPEGIKRMYVFRSLLDAHAHLAFGTDWPVAPLDPVLGFYAAVTRRTLDDKHPEGWVPEQKITLEETLRAYTVGSAYAAFAEQSRGMLKPGYRADLVLFEQDLTKLPPEELRSATVGTTIVGGKVVYRK